MKERLNKRHERYFVNAQTHSFNNSLKGLTVIELNITELCTRSCSFCPRSDSKVYKNHKKFMNLNTVSSLIKNCIEYQYGGDLHICGFGEPTTNPQIVDIVSNIRASLSNRIALTTNGDLLSVSLLSELLKAGLSYVIISCYDGPEEKQQFIEMLKRAGYTEDQFDIRELWTNPEETQSEFLDRNLFSNRGGLIVDERKKLNTSSPCFLPFYKILIDWNGEVILCCNDWLKINNNLGNINKDSLEAIWYSSSLTNIRSNLIDGNRQTNKSCKDCNICGTVVGSLSVSVLNFNK